MKTTNSLNSVLQKKVLDELVFFLLFDYTSIHKYLPHGGINKGMKEIHLI